MGWILALTPTLGNAGNGAGNVLTKIHDLLLYSIPQLAKMPRDQKYLLGDRIETKMLEVLEHAIRASYRKDKRPHLVEADMAPRSSAISCASPTACAIFRPKPTK